MLCPVMQCYDNRGDRGDCDEKEKQNNWGDQDEWGDEITDKTRQGDWGNCDDRDTQNDRDNQDDQGDWDDKRTELIRMTGKTAVAGMNGMTS